MDVHLLVYDLSGGLARQMSLGLLGFQLDAIYHTSIELEGREYVYDGGIISIVPGTSHLGKPLERMPLGKTHLPMDVVEEFIESMRPIFTLEAYDLFRHNCNNFTDTFSNFLVGKGIPGHIANMPQAVMDSPLGRMLLPQLTQGVKSGRQNGSILGLEQSARPAQPASASTSQPKAKVDNVATPEDFTRLLNAAATSCAVVFFTSATCPPCKTLYPLYDQLAEEHGDKATFLKVDISNPQASAIASKLSIRATPTIVTFLKGQEENRWSGADSAKLRGNVQLLVQMAHPQHPHAMMRLPTFSGSAKPVLFSKLPPIPKLLAKMGGDFAGRPGVQGLKKFVETGAAEGAGATMLPEMAALTDCVRDSVAALPLDSLFGIVDLFRCALLDPRVSGFYAEEADHTTIRSILDYANGLDACPYALRLVTLQMTCNLFSSRLFAEEMMRSSGLRRALTQLVSSSFLDDAHNNVRVAASSLLYNVALAERTARSSGGAKPGLPEEDQVELAAAVVEAIGQEAKSVEALQGMLSALGHLVYGTALDGELADLLRALDAEGTVAAKRKAFPNEKLVGEMVELLGRGLRRP